VDFHYNVDCLGSLDRLHHEITIFSVSPRDEEPRVAGKALREGERSCILTSIDQDCAFTCHEFPQCLPQWKIGLKEVDVSVEENSASVAISTVGFVSDVEDLDRNALRCDLLYLVSFETELPQLSLYVAALMAGVKLKSDLVHSVFLGGRVLCVRIGSVVEVGGVVDNKLLLDQVVVGKGIGQEELINSWVLIIEGCEVNLVDIGNGGVNVAVEDVVALKLEVFLHSLQVFRNIGTILIQKLERLIGTIVDFVVEVVPVLAEVDKALVSVLRKRDIDLVVDLG
jgi:hypothetical protein